MVSSTSAAVAKRLFLDEAHIAQKTNLIRAFHSVTKHPHNPVMVPDKPWERSMGHAFGKVLYEDGKFRLWYQSFTMPGATTGTFQVAYAESSDGFSWTKPDLGIVEVSGSRQNNLIMSNAAWPNFLRDEREPDPARRYKMLYFGRGDRPTEGALSGWCGMDVGYWGWCVAYSADALHWQPHPDNPVSGDADDGGHLFGWDDSVGKYVAYLMPMTMLAYKVSMGRSIPFEEWSKDPLLRAFPRRRLIGYTTSDDFVHWERARTIIVPEDGDPPALEFYPMTVLKYHDWYIGMIYALYCEPDEPMMRSRGLMDTQLAISRDGVHWTRMGGHRPFIPRGPRGSFDAGMVGPNNGLIEKDGKLWFFYNAWTGEHYETKQYRYGTQPPAVPGLLAMGRLASGLGLAHLRVDGFVSLDAGEDEGVLTTTQEAVNGQELVINAAVLGSGGYVGAEIVSPTGVVDGFSFAECDTFRGDDVAHRVTWQGKSTQALKAGSYAIRVRLRHASLYAYTWAAPATHSG